MISSSVPTRASLYGGGGYVSSLLTGIVEIITKLIVRGAAIFYETVVFRKSVTFEITPICAILPLLDSELANKLYVDNSIGDFSNLLILDNVWTGENKYESRFTVDNSRGEVILIEGVPDPYFKVHTDVGAIICDFNFSIDALDMVLTASNDIALNGESLILNGVGIDIDGSVYITLEAVDITLTGTVISASITAQITSAVAAEAVFTADALSSAVVGLQSEIGALQAQIILKANIESPTFTGTVSGVTKAMVGLGSADNTSDLNKPISTATQTALNAKGGLTTTNTWTLAQNFSAAGAFYTGTPTVAQSGVVLTITNQNTLDTSMHGTIAGESVYNQLQMGARPFLMAQGVDNLNMYMGMGGGGTPDPDFEYTMRRGVGLKIAPYLSAPGDQSSFTDALRVIGAISSTGNIQGITPTIFGYLSGITSNVQTQLNSKGILASPNAWTSTNSYTILPTCSAVPVSDTDLTNKLYVDYHQASNDNVRITALEVKTTNQSFASDTTTFTGTVAGITKTMVGLSNVDNTSDANKPVSTATQTALDLKANIASPTFTGTVSGITKTMVGLGNVDNTSDADKPVSTATQTALNLKGTLAGANSWTSTNSYSLLPTCSGVPALNTDLTNKLYVDSHATSDNARLVVLETKTTNQSFAGVTTTFTGTFNVAGTIDSTSTTVNMMATPTTLNIGGSSNTTNLLSLTDIPKINNVKGTGFDLISNVSMSTSLTNNYDTSLNSYQLIGSFTLYGDMLSSTVTFVLSIGVLDESVVGGTGFIQELIYVQIRDNGTPVYTTANLAIVPNTFIPVEDVLYVFPTLTITTSSLPSSNTGIVYQIYGQAQYRYNLTPPLDVLVEDPFFYRRWNITPTTTLTLNRSSTTISTPPVNSNVYTDVLFSNNIPVLTCSNGIPTVFQGNCIARITNSTSLDTTISGSIAGEYVYGQLQLGTRAFVIGQGVDNINTYMGMAGGGSPDPDYEYTLRRGVGLKIAPLYDTGAFYEALKVIGVTYTTKGGSCIRNYAAGAYFIISSVRFNNWYPIHYSVTNMSNITSQTQTSGTTGYVAMSGTAVGTWSNYESFGNDLEFVYIYPRFGIICYTDVTYGGAILLNFYNNTNNPVFVKPSVGSSASSYKFYYGSTVALALANELLKL